MSGITWRTAGESHGRGLVGIIEGLPAGLTISEKAVLHELQRRQKGYGRGARMQIEKDHAEFISGVRFGQTIGSPIALYIENKDWVNWTEIMALFGDPPEGLETVTVPRPGHADLAGSLKYHHHDIRNVIERASARETAMRVALGAIARQLLEYFSIRIISEVIQIGKASVPHPLYQRLGELSDSEFEKYIDRIEKSPVHCGDELVASQMQEVIDTARERGDTVGGRLVVMALQVPVGLGS
ncbi:MAG: chorismate synthase, partial [candidate division KSB1 bacterium]|nr:chorismate synthase [candidate division KSB1 bacterium]